MSPTRKSNRGIPADKKLIKLFTVFGRTRVKDLDLNIERLAKELGIYRRVSFLKCLQSKSRRRHK